jgi:hypothetical protein
MFFKKKTNDDEDDAQFGELDQLVGQGKGEEDTVAEGIRRALQRDDLTPEDRAEFEAALKRLNEGATTPPAGSPEQG